LCVEVSFCPTALFVYIVADSSRSLGTAGPTSSDLAIDMRNTTQDICGAARNIKETLAYFV